MPMMAITITVCVLMIYLDVADNPVDWQAVIPMILCIALLRLMSRVNLLGLPILPLLLLMGILVLLVLLVLHLCPGAPSSFTNLLAPSWPLWPPSSFSDPLQNLAEGDLALHGNLDDCAVDDQDLGPIRQF